VGALDAANDGTVAIVAAAAGFTGDKLPIAVAIAFAESDGNPGAVGDINNPVAGARSIGLWQINTHYHPSYDQAKLTDPLYNARAAFAIAGSGSSFTPWSTYKSGAYRSKLERANKAVRAVTPERVAALAPYQTLEEVPGSGGDSFGFHLGTPIGDLTSESGPTGVLADAVNAAIDPMVAIAHLAGALLNPRVWLRVLFVLLAAVLIVSGARLIVADTAGL
jgi:hypothetical protein